VRSALHEHRRRNGLVEHATPLRGRTYTNRTTTQIPIRTSGHRIVEPRGAIDVSSGCVRRRKATGGTAVHANTCVVRETPKEHQRCRHAYLFTCQGTGYLHRLTTIPSSITSSPKHQLYKRTIVFVRSGREERREMSQRTKPPDQACAAAGRGVWLRQDTEGRVEPHLLLRRERRSEPAS
jgi:hypothetical protein